MIHIYRDKVVGVFCAFSCAATTDITKRDFVNINIDYGQTGIGDNSWSPSAVAHEKYRVKSGNLRVQL
jgi:hypothetical protein